jgi:hypothetical protein
MLGTRVLSVIAVFLLSAFTLTITTGTAQAATFQEKLGQKIDPGQPYAGKPKGYDWVGSYEVNGKQVFCVRFALIAPDSNEVYKPGDELKTKWGTPLSADTAANISYLLLRYGNTTSATEAAALAHLLHSWTSAPRTKADLDPKLDFKHIAYDIDMHFNGLPKDAQAMVKTMEKDAEANRGPWTTSVTAPKDEQVIGTAADWSVSVKNAKGNGVSNVPVKLTLTSGTFADGKNTATVTTDKDGNAKVKVTPTDENVKLSSSLSGPADKPYVQFPVRADVQQVVSTGGEKELTAQATVKARTKPGIVQVTKLDSKTGEGISGVSLRLTGEDKTSAAVGQDGKDLLGADNKPAVLVTGKDGKATVENLKTPQKVCVTEVSAPTGYDQAFDPNNPPTACGEVKAGETLALEIKNTPNEVPRIISAGGPPIASAQSATTSSVPSGVLFGLGGAVLVGAVFAGLLMRRRFSQR